MPESLTAEPRYFIEKVDGEYRIKDRKKAPESAGRKYDSLRAISSFVRTVSKIERLAEREVVDYSKTFMNQAEIIILERILDGEDWGKIKRRLEIR